MLTLWSGSIRPSHHRSRPRESLHYHCGACSGRTREWFGGPVHSLGSRTNCGILGVPPWNDFCPRQNPTPLIKLFVFSESPTVEWFRECSGSVQTMGRDDQILVVTALFLCPNLYFRRASWLTRQALTQNRRARRISGTSHRFVLRIMCGGEAAVVGRVIRCSVRRSALRILLARTRPRFSCSSLAHCVPLFAAREQLPPKVIRQNQSNLSTDAFPQRCRWDALSRGGVSPYPQEKISGIDLVREAVFTVWCSQRVHFELIASVRLQMAKTARGQMVTRDSAGLMLMLRWKRLSGSYSAFIPASRASLSVP